MDSFTIKWEKSTFFTGRNGLFNCNGIEVWPNSNDNPVISPITSKGKTGRCDICIPKQVIPELIKKFSGDVNNSDTLKISELRNALITIQSILGSWDEATKDGKYRNILFYIETIMTKN